MFVKATNHRFQSNEKITSLYLSLTVRLSRMSNIGPQGSSSRVQMVFKPQTNETQFNLYHDL